MTPKPHFLKAKHVWILQTGFVGDTILALPLVAECARVFADAEITFISTSAGCELFEQAKHEGLKAFGSRLRALEFKKRNEHRGFFAMRAWVKSLCFAAGQAPDVVFCVQRSTRSGLMSFFSQAAIRVGFSSGAATLFYTHMARRDWEGPKGEIEKNLDLLRTLGIEVPLWSPDLASPLLKNAPKRQSREGQRRVGLSIGSPWATKMWPIEENIELVRRLTDEGIEVVLLGDPAAGPLGDTLVKQVPSLLVKNRVGKTSLREWVDQIADLDVLVSGDSAAVHVASDLRVPVLALFGPTVPEFGFAPWRKDSLVLQVAGLKCRPCDLHGPKVCPLGHHRCLVDLKAERVFSFLNRRLPELRK